MTNQLYIKRSIKEHGNPKEKGWFTCFIKNSTYHLEWTGTHWNYDGDNITAIDAYLQPITLSELLPKRELTEKDFEDEIKEIYYDGIGTSEAIMNCFLLHQSALAKERERHDELLNDIIYLNRQLINEREETIKLKEDCDELFSRWTSQVDARVECEKELKQEIECVEHMKEVCDNYEKDLKEEREKAEKLLKAAKESLIYSNDIEILQQAIQQYENE